MLDLARGTIALCALLGLAACARRHDEIGPEIIEPGVYAQASCPQLARMHAKTMRSLIFAELVQDKHYADDASGHSASPRPWPPSSTRMWPPMSRGSRATLSRSRRKWSVRAAWRREGKARIAQGLRSLARRGNRQAFV